LIGIRVVDEQGRPIGFARSAVRVTLLSLSSFAVVIIYTMTKNPMIAGLLSAAAWLVTSLILPFSTARKSNGWRMFHDVVTKTRVVRPIPRPRQRRSDIDASKVPSLSGHEEALGQYALLGDVAAHPGLVAGWDRAMQRRVWIAQPQSAANELSDARRSVSRLTRLRWTGGVRNDDGRWDVFEAPSGEPLEERLKRPVPWLVMRNWLSDLLGEARAAEADGSWPASASIEQLWVTAADEIVLTDALPQQTGNGGKPGSTALLAELARLLLNRESEQPLPIYASHLLREIGKAGTVDAIDGALRETFGRPVEVTRRRRIGPMIIVTGVCLVVGLFSRFIFLQIAKSDPAGALADGLVGFINDSRACSIEVQDAQRIKRCLPGTSRNDSATTTGRKIGAAAERAWNAMGLPSLANSTDGTPKTPAEASEEKRLAGIYLATQLTARIADTTTREQPGLGVEKQKKAREIIRNYPSPSAADSARAVSLVDSLWQRQSNHGMSQRVTVVTLILVPTLAVMFAILSVLATIVARRGLLLRGFQLDFVTRDGQPASRIRLTARMLLVWSIFLIVVAGILIVNVTPVAMHAPLLGFVTIATVVAWIYGIVTVIRTPTRGLPERLTGTYVVVE
jgi:hypothetical protein